MLPQHLVAKITVVLKIVLVIVVEMLQLMNVAHVILIALMTVHKIVQALGVVLHGKVIVVV